MLWLLTAMFVSTANLEVARADREMWPTAVLEVAKLHFEKPVILFLDFFTVANRSNTLVPPRIFDGVSEVLAGLARNWSLVTSNINYDRRKDDHFSVRAAQIIALIDSKIGRDPEILTDVIHTWSENLVWFGDAKILVVVEAAESDAQKFAENIFNELWRQTRSINIVVLVSHVHNITFFAWEPYSASCKIQAFVRGSWHNQYTGNSDLFPLRQFSNLNNCTIRVTATPLIPYVFPPDKNQNYHEGIEIRMFSELSKALNFSYAFQPVPAGQSAWLSVLNGTPSGMVGVLYRGEADVSLSGSRLTFERSQYVDPIDSYYGDDFTWIGPTAKRTPRWKGVFLVFNRKAWACIGATFLASTFMVAALFRWKRGASRWNFNKSFFLMWAINMNNSVPPRLFTSQTVIRCFVCCFLCYLTVVNSLYGSGLYTVLTKGLSMETFDSAKDAAEAGMIVSIFPSNIPDLKETVPNFYNYITSHGLVEWTEDYMSCFRRAARQGDCFNLFTGLGGRYQTNLRFTSSSGKQYLHVMRNRYKSYEPVLYMKRHHPLLPVIKKKIQQMVESGLVLSYINTILTASLRNRSIATEVADFSEEEEKKELSLEQVIGAFIAPMVILVTAVIAFAWEVTFRRRATCRKFKEKNSTRNSVLVTENSLIVLDIYQKYLLTKL